MLRHILTSGTLKYGKKCIFGHCKMNQVSSLSKSKAQPGLTITMSEHLKTCPPLDTCKIQRPEKRKLIPPFLLVLKACPSASPVNLVLGQKVHSGFLYHLMGKPEWTFWPTQTLTNTSQLWSAMTIFQDPIISSLVPLPSSVPSLFSLHPHWVVCDSLWPRGL